MGPPARDRPEITVRRESSRFRRRRASPLARDADRRVRIRPVRRRTSGLAALAWLLSAGVSAQETAPPPPTTLPAPRDTLVNPPLSEPAPPREAFTLTFHNRPIAVLRARLLGRTPEERGRVRAARLMELAENNPTGPVEWHV